jgi:peptidyl-prolyl cis-trans isomerase SurA
MTSFPFPRRSLCCAAVLWGALAATAPAQTAQNAQGLRGAPRPAAPAAPVAAPQVPRRAAGDFIVAVVNRELVTNSEVQSRVERIVQEESKRGTQLPPRDELQRQVLDQLIDERAQLAFARETGVRVDEADIDRAVQSIAAQNQMTVAQIRERMRSEGIDYLRLRENLRDQMLLERVREREVQSRIRITDTEIENWLAAQRTKAGLSTEYNIAQILVTVPEGAGPTELAQRRAIAVQALQRIHAGADFATVVREVSDASKDNGGALGLRPAARLPDVFVEAVTPLKPGEVAPQVVRSGAGFHVIKLVERKDANLAVTETHARHILLRPGPALTEDAALARLIGYKRDIEGGRARFEDLARRFSEDGSAASGGDLGWAGPGRYVPEFEQALNELQPNQISDPVTSRFGVHLIQLLERRQTELDARQQREAARSALKEEKYEGAYNEWARETRARAYVEMREPPQ